MIAQATIHHDKKTWLHQVCGKMLYLQNNAYQLVDTTYKRLYPTDAGPPQLLLATQDPQIGHTHRSRVSSRGAVTCRVAKVLANILRPLVEYSSHHIRNTQDFVDQVKSIRLWEGKYITSFDVKVLFTSVPVDLNISIIK